MQLHRALLLGKSIQKKRIIVVVRSALRSEIGSQCVLKHAFLNKY